MNTEPIIIPKLSSYSLPWPTDWAAVFGVQRPLILEIGFGLGQMLHYLHQCHPDHNIIGLEINNFCLEKAEKAITQQHMHNVRVLHSRAETALHHLFTPGSLGQIHINFPDPWFKDRHAGRRLMQRDTLNAMVSRLAVGGFLYLATDILAYAEMSHDLLTNTPGLSNALDAAWVNAYPHRVQTKYERKARQAGRDCYYFAYQRNITPTPDVPVMKELEMPHIVLHTPLDLNTMYAEVQVHYAQPAIYSVDDIHVNLLNKYHGENALLFETFIQEPTIQQRLALVLVARDGHPNEYTLKLSTLGHPRPTEGVHRAVRAVGDLLLQLHPQAQIIQEKVRGGKG